MTLKRFKRKYRQYLLRYRHRFYGCAAMEHCIVRYKHNPKRYVYICVYCGSPQMQIERNSEGDTYASFYVQPSLGK